MPSLLKIKAVFNRLSWNQDQSYLTEGELSAYSEYGKMRLLPHVLYKQLKTLGHFKKEPRKRRNIVLSYKLIVQSVC